MNSFLLGFLVGVALTCAAVSYVLDRILRKWQL